MSLFSLIIMAIGLSIDSLAASITTGACCRYLRLKHILKVAMFMAVFQGFMPLIGWLIGSSFKKLIADYDHWVAFVILLGIGAKLMYDGIKAGEDGESSKTDPTKSIVLIGMAIATSIDALILGISFGIIEVNIQLAMLIIAITTFVFSSVGVYIGEKIGNKINKGIEIFGGLVLIGLGFKILLEHTCF